MFAETQYLHRCIIHLLGINSTIIARMPSLGGMPPELLAHILSFVPAYVPVKYPDCRLFRSQTTSALCRRARGDSTRQRQRHSCRNGACALSRAPFTVHGTRSAHGAARAGIWRCAEKITANSAQNRRWSLSGRRCCSTLRTCCPTASWTPSSARLGRNSASCQSTQHPPRCARSARMCTLRHSTYDRCLTGRSRRTCCTKHIT